ncbi:RhoGAP-domain-containing protein [Dacryopinax primogenitus]|uniref:RhoGAP-domain-containing protein n=1 Tax=Dacryopinax primogenitus (strain DJM 731) TaxID=1858805 RepID=M5GF71_DACPD|nr:RhoGAP-domain-containing protein [Dacryopinax primogenitus]EJU03903.1 RhoGAP-domain-containing protein [Dacryopinax primogenitus]
MSAPTPSSSSLRPTPAPSPSNPTTPSLPSTFHSPEHRRVLTESSSRLLTPPSREKSGSGPGSGSPANPGHSASAKPITLDVLLALHSSAQDPMQAALDQLLVERNSLASQNAQLWKLIERARMTQRSLERDCERLRGERDRAVGRERERERREKEGRASEESEHLQEDAPSAANVKGEDAPRTAASAPPALTTSTASRSLAAVGATTGQISPVSPVPPTSGPSTALSSLPTQMTPPAPAPTPATSRFAAPPVPPTVASQPQPSQIQPPAPAQLPPTQPPAAPAQPPLQPPPQTQIQTQTTAPLVLKQRPPDPSPLGPAAVLVSAPSPATPTRSSSLPFVSPGQLAPPAQLVQQVQPIPPSQHIQPTSTQPQPIQPLQPVQPLAPVQYTHPPRPWAPNPDFSQPSTPSTSSCFVPAPTPPTPAAAIAAGLVPLPSPAASIRATASASEPDSPLDPGTQHLLIPSSAAPVAPGPGTGPGVGAGQPQSPKRGTPNVNVVPPTPAPAHMHTLSRPEEIPVLPAIFARDRERPDKDKEREREREKDKDKDKERDPPVLGNVQPQQQLRQHSPSPGPLSPTSTSTRSVQQAQQQPQLVPADLPLTTVLISHSSIRANDRGKDVLSFHIAVSPPPFLTPSSRDPVPDRGSPSSSASEPGVGLGIRDAPAQRQPWAVEKLYSDILALDTKVRSELGRTMQKKLGPLPEGKAFRDHAPVKSDQRKAALTAYLQALLTFPLSIDTRRAICVFFTSDFTRARATSGAVGGGVVREGYKEGYLTKRGKNFGGWKTRYFVLGGRVLEYYESRGGAHLGSIQLQNAKIGRQQRATASSSSSSLALSRETTSSTTGPNPNNSDLEDENAYRHAFLIIEQREGKAPVKHVLCAESDEERDSWVEHLVRYVGPAGPVSIVLEEDGDPRSSTEIRSRSKIMSKDEISVFRAAPVPISQLVPDAENAKLFRVAPPPPSPGPPGPVPPAVAQLAAGPHIPGYSGPDSPRLLSVSASVPSTLDTIQGMPRSNSSLGTYSDGSSRAMPPDQRVHNLTTAASRLTNSQNLTPGKMRESGIAPSASQRTVTGSASSSTLLGEPQGSDRERKAKSGRFWNFGRSNDSKGSSSSASQLGIPVGAPAHAVFGVALQDSLSVASIANLPAVVFRCIEYLEARGAEREEGIYRLSGSSAVVKALRERFNAEGDVDLVKCDEYWDLHAVAGLLKGYLRELPTSVLTRELHLRFLAVIGVFDHFPLCISHPSSAVDLMDAQERIAELASLIAALPLPNYSLLRALTAHLILIVQHSQENKMNMRNVGIVFSPTLGIPAGVFSLMLAEFNHVFSVGGEDEPDADEDVVEADTLGASEFGEDIEYKPRVSGEGGTPRSRNSRSYASGAADQLLGLSGRSLKPEVADLDEASDSDQISNEGSGTETEDADVDSISLQDGRSTSEQSTGDEKSTIPMPGSATQAMFDVNQTPTQAQTNGNGSRARKVANARGLQLAPPGLQADLRPMGKVGLPVSPRPPLQKSPRP